MRQDEPATPGRRLVTLGRAAEYADTTPRLLRAMISRGELTGYRLGARQIRVDLDELDEALTPIAVGIKPTSQTLEEHIRAVVAKAPPLTREQQDRLALLLRGDAA